MALSLVRFPGLLTATALAAGDADAAVEKIGISLVSLSNPFAVSLVEGATAWAKDVNPDVEVIAVASDDNSGRQAEHVDNFVAMKVDLILFDTRDAMRLAPALEGAKEAGIALVAIDRPATDAHAAVRVDHRKAGYLACRYIAERLRHRGKAIIQPGPPRAPFQQRAAGCKAAFGESEAIEILAEMPRGGASVDGGKLVMERHLARFPNIDAVFTSTDLQAVGADMAARAAGRNRIVIASVGGAPEIENALKSRTLIEASAAIDPYLMGQLAIEIGYRLILGEPLDTREVVVEPQLITRDSVRDYQGWLRPR